MIINRYGKSPEVTEYYGSYKSLITTSRKTIELLMEKVRWIELEDLLDFNWGRSIYPLGLDKVLSRGDILG